MDRANSSEVNIGSFVTCLSQHIANKKQKQKNPFPREEETRQDFGPTDPHSLIAILGTPTPYFGPTDPHSLIASLGTPTPYFGPTDPHSLIAILGTPTPYFQSAIKVTLETEANALWVVKSSSFCGHVLQPFITDN